MKATLTSYLEDFISLIFPHLCLACGDSLRKGEETICLSCQYFLPKTGFHLDAENPIQKIFWGRVKVTHASAYYYFRKGSKVQHLIHQLKYNGRQEVGVKIGNWYGKELSRVNAYRSIDLILPVPLHPRKEKLRGYNQSDCIATGLSSGMDIPWSREVLERSTFSETQTKKSRMDRWQNVGEIFRIAQAEDIRNKHVLLVDDVLTTGSTLEACAQVLLDAGCPKVSIVTLAWAIH